MENLNVGRLLLRNRDLKKKSLRIYDKITWQPWNRIQLLAAGLLILHDNVRSHIADVVTKKIHDYGWEVLPHAPYSPDMTSPDFDLFSKLKE